MVANYPVTFDVDYPARPLNRLTTAFRIFVAIPILIVLGALGTETLAIPHYIVLVFLAIGALVAVIVAWFAILFTGKYPRGLFDFVVGVFRWGNRVNGYAFALVTDQYPPFRLN
jgi:hypothetical protein